MVNSIHPRVIPIAERRPTSGSPDDASQGTLPTGVLHDRRARRLHDLRISVTDRCNFRCVYCMPRDVFDQNYPYVPHAALLSFEEITRLARVFVAHGVEKLRLTGGEPLLRKGIEELVAMLADIKLPDGRPCDLTLTTNGSLLARKAEGLKRAGLKRVTVSLDALDDQVFRRMNDADFPVAEVLEGIRAAHAAGLGPVKVNMVVRRGINEDEILPMARYFRHTGHVVRFIEYMDVGTSNGWRMQDVVTSAEVIARIDDAYALVPVGPNYPGEVAQRWRYRDGAGEIGVISSVSQAFCASCSRARLSTEGALYTCLFATAGVDLRRLLRSAASDADIARAISRVWQSRDDRYSEIRSEHTTALRKVEMSYIGG